MLSGGAVAASQITGKQIKDSSITGKDVKNKSLTKRDFRGSVRGARGFAGPAGPAGPQGPAGPTVVGQLTIVKSAQVPYGPADTVMGAQAFCPAGQRVVSGGGTNVGDEQLAATEPNDSRTGWFVIGVDRVDNGGEYVQATAVCGPANQAVAASTQSRARARTALANRVALIARQQGAR